ncbi:MAG: tetratricopeptide repeat protein [Spirochaetales bacterium]|nr:tetratricopeptide repeat protein [Spirochaetales bacterium]
MKRRIILVLLPVTFIMSAGFYWFLGRPEEPDKTELDLYFRALKAYEEGNLSSAVYLAETLCNGNAGFFQARLLLARAYFFNDRYPEAEDQLRAVLKSEPACTDAHLWLLRTLVQEGRLEDAKNYGKGLLSLSSEDPRILGLLAGIARTQGDIQRALEYYKRALLFEEELALQRIELAKLYMQFFHPEEAAEHLKRSLVLLSPESPLYPTVLELSERCEEIHAKEVPR